MSCAHERKRGGGDVNDDRARVIQWCVDCDAYRMGTIAFRLAEDGQEAWGPVNVWWWTPWERRP